MSNTSEPMITISRQRYEKLIQVELKLQVLEAAGVDNWEGYDDAMEMLKVLENEGN